MFIYLETKKLILWSKKQVGEIASFFLRSVNLTGISDSIAVKCNLQMSTFQLQSRSLIFSFMLY